MMKKFEINLPFLFIAFLLLFSPYNVEASGKVNNTKDYDPDTILTDVAPSPSEVKTNENERPDTIGVRRQGDIGWKLPYDFKKTNEPIIWNDTIAAPPISEFPPDPSIEPDIKVDINRQNSFMNPPRRTIGKFELPGGGKLMPQK